MKRSTGRLLAVLLAALTLLASGCGEKQETPDGAPDKPLMQEEDLTVEPQPDANFTLELPDGFLSLGTDYEPNGETQDMTYDSDGMLPYDFARNYDDKAVCVPLCLRCGPRRGAAPCGRKPRADVRAVKKAQKARDA